MRFVSPILLLVFTLPLPGLAEDACAGFRLDVAAELQLATSPATAVTASRAAAEAPRVAIGQRLAVTLAPESTVKPAVAPRKSFEGGHAGFVLVEPTADGTYGVGSAARLWIEVVDLTTGTAIPSSDFDGRHGCTVLAKIVEFPLKAGGRYAVQLTSAPAEKVQISVTRRAAQP